MYSTPSASSIRVDAATVLVEAAREMKWPSTDFKTPEEYKSGMVSMMMLLSFFALKNWALLEEVSTVLVEKLSRMFFLLCNPIYTLFKDGSYLWTSVGEDIQ